MLTIALPGHRFDIPDLHLYFALSQILPVSFTQNLFAIAVLLHSHNKQLREPSAPPSQPRDTRKRSTAGPGISDHSNGTGRVFVVHLLSICLSGLLAASRTSDVSQVGYLVLLVFAARLLLLSPYLLTRYVKTSNTGESQNKIDRRLAVWLAPAIDMVGIRIIGALLELSFVKKRANFWSSPGILAQREWEALGQGSAIAAFGWDLIIGLSSWMICRTWIWIDPISTLG